MPISDYETTTTKIFNIPGDYIDPGTGIFVKLRLIVLHDEPTTALEGELFIDGRKNQLGIKINNTHRYFLTPVFLTSYSFTGDGTTNHIVLPDNFTANTTRLYVDGVRLYPKNSSTELTGYYDYEEIINSDGTYNKIKARYGGDNPSIPNSSKCFIEYIVS